jgi:hypothetical protein
MQSVYGGAPLQQGLQGKSVDSLEVIKAMDIPLDGSVSYFPLVDGSAIVTKQLQQDGTSKIVVYKPIENESAEQDSPNYVTKEQFDEAMKKLDTNKDIKDLKDDMKAMKRQIRYLTDDLKEDLKSKED